MAMTVAKNRLTQTFKFLKELNELRNPVPREMSVYTKLLRVDEWPAHSSIEVRRGDRKEEDDANGEAEMEPIIRIRRADLTPCPNPPRALEGWLKPGWQFVETQVEVFASRNFANKEKGKVTVAFDDDPQRMTGLSEWAAARMKWIDAEWPAVAARELFEEIHALWTTMQREGDRTELVLGDGLLDVPADLIRHPVLLQRVNLRFDPSGPEFRFDAGTERVELHRALLRLIPSIEGPVIAQFDKELEETPVEPLGGQSTTDFLRRLVHALFATDGEFVDGETHAATPDRPSMHRMPVIFLRARSAGLATTLDHIVEDLEKNDSTPPEGLTRIVGVETEGSIAGSPGVSTDENVPTPPGSEPDILFSKPANSEQYEIAARLAKSKAVLVQGPPGTGKTHTIANLLGCLLAQGKTVLVTAHTTKALRVLRNQVDEALRPLCLSVLESDADSHAQLSRAAQDIASRLSISDAAGLRRHAGVLREKRSEFLRVEEALRRQIRDARFSEVDEVVIGDEALSPIEVAKRVKADAPSDGWIPGPLQSGVLCPLTDAEVRQLYASNGTLTRGDEAQLSGPQPVLARLVTPADFRSRAAERAGADSRAQAHRPELWVAGAGSNLTAGELQRLHSRVNAVALVLGEKSQWLREVLFAGWSGGDLRETWRDLLAAIDALVGEAGTAQRLVAAYGPELPEGRPVDDVAAMLRQIVDHLDGGGSLGLKTRVTRRAWHTLLEACHVDVRAANAFDKVRALRAKAQLEVNRKRLAERWRRLVECHDGPAFDTFGAFPERAAQGYGREIRARLEWRVTVWEPLIGELHAAGFRWQGWLAAHPVVAGDYGELARVERAASQGLAEVIEAQAALMRQAELSAALSQQRTYLAAFPQSEAASILLQAQDEWHAEMYEEAFRQLARLDGLADAYQTRMAQLALIESGAPEWARAISQRRGIHDATQPLGDSTAAWRWRQWHQELERRASVSLSDLQERLNATEDELRRLSAQIIELETWAAQRDRAVLQSQQALMGYVQTIRKVGKGTGRRVPELLRQARLLLASARRAVPVWIMPLSRVYESFDPRETRFDVVIIDEASQSDVTALAALYFGREHVVVGDKEQVTPDDVGQRLDSVQRLIDTNLQGIPNSHLYDGQTSIYDLAETAFGGVVALREHFRCVPEIIQFSNDLSYNSTIRPLREPMSASVRPALVAHRVDGFRDTDGKTNQVEAEEIASLVVGCLHDPAYALNEFGQPTTFGVISLLGVEQALLIEEMLRRRLSPSTFAKHRLLCGNAAQFQGDERDVVFLSMVDAPPDNGQLPNRDAGPRDLYKKRFNVAVSRARNQLWVVHSLDPSAHLKPRDLRRRLIEHAHEPQALLRAFVGQGKRTDSIFETLVLQRLLATGYRVHTQWPVGADRIDLVVEGSSNRLAVECDGEKWHTSEQLQRDIDRQAVLERIGNGWKFVRVRGSVFFRDPDAAMAPVFAKLDQLGIEPLGDGIAPPDPSGVIEQIRRKAETLRMQWQREKKDAEAAQSIVSPSRTENTRSSLTNQESHAQSRRTLRPRFGASRASQVAVTQQRKARQPTADSNRVLKELRDLDSRFRDPSCSQCGHAADLAITVEGIVVACRDCKMSRRVDTDTLQRLADRVAAVCLSCRGRLKSVARPFGNILKCESPGCPYNTWKGISDRLGNG